VTVTVGERANQMLSHHGESDVPCVAFWSGVVTTGQWDHKTGLNKTSSNTKCHRTNNHFPA